MISVDVCCHHYLKCGSAKTSRWIMVQQHPCFFVSGRQLTPSTSPNRYPSVRSTKDWMLVAPLYEKCYTSVVIHIKTNIMSKWISIEAASIKYEISEKVLLVWGNQGVMPIKRKNGVTYVYTPYIDYSIHQKCDSMTSELLDTLEELCLSKTAICNQNLQTIKHQNEIIMHQRRIIESLKEVQSTMRSQDLRLRDCRRELMIYKNKYYRANWKTKICLQFERMMIKLQRFFSI